MGRETAPTAQQIFRQQKSALTRALNTSNPELRADRVERAVRGAVHAWNLVDGPFGGWWPDDWARWQRALDDSRPWNAPYIDITAVDF